MFEQTFVQTGKTKKGYTVIVSALVQLALVGVGVIIPMWYFDALPTTQLQSMLVAPPPPPATAMPKPVKLIPRQFDGSKLMAPKVVPKEIAQIKEEELAPPSSGVGVVGGVP